MCQKISIFFLTVHCPDELEYLDKCWILSAILSSCLEQEMYYKHQNCWRTFSYDVYPILSCHSNEIWSDALYWCGSGHDIQFISLTKKALIYFDIVIALQFGLILYHRICCLVLRNLLSILLFVIALHFGLICITLALSDYCTNFFKIDDFVWNFKSHL